MPLTLHPTQIVVAKDRHRFRVLCNGRRWGKTTLAIEEMKAKLAVSSSRVCYIAPTFQQARDICWEKLKKELQAAAVEINESRLEIKIRNFKGTESFAVLRGWEAIETLRGQQFDFIVIDEVATMRDFWTGWNNVISPTLLDTKGEVLFISTPKGFNHFYHLYNKESGVGWENGPDPDFKSFHYTTFDNPFMSVEEIEREKKALPEDSFAQEFLADFRKRTGLVYPEFNIPQHTYDDELKRAPIIRRYLGVDFGYTNPTAIITIEKTSDDQYWISDEWYRTGKTNAEVGEYIRSLNPAPNKVYPDPAEPDRIEELRRLKINVQEVSKDVEAGIDSIRELLKSQRLHVNVKCPNIISELETYRYEEKRENRNMPERPVKEDDHGLDAARYVLHNVKEDKPKPAHTFVPSHVLGQSMRGIMLGQGRSQKMRPKTKAKQYGRHPS